MVEAGRGDGDNAADELGVMLGEEQRMGAAEGVAHHDDRPTLVGGLGRSCVELDELGDDRSAAAPGSSSSTRASGRVTGTRRSGTVLA